MFFYNFRQEFRAWKTTPFLLIIAVLFASLYSRYIPYVLRKMPWLLTNHHFLFGIQIRPAINFALKREPFFSDDGPLSFRVFALCGPRRHTNAAIREVCFELPLSVSDYVKICDSSKDSNFQNLRRESVLVFDNRNINLHSSRTNS